MFEIFKNEFDFLLEHNMNKVVIVNHDQLSMLLIHHNYFKFPSQSVMNKANTTRTKFCAQHKFSSERLEWKSTLSNYMITLLDFKQYFVKVIAFSEIVNVLLRNYL